MIYYINEEFSTSRNVLFLHNDDVCLYQTPLHVVYNLFFDFSSSDEIDNEG